MIDRDTVIQSEEKRPPVKPASDGRRRARSRGRPRRSNGVATRERLIQTASVLFAQGGYKATSLRQIAGGADVDIATLKYHFGDKKNLFSEVYRGQHKDFIEFISPKLHAMADIQTSAELTEHLRALVGGIHDFIAEHMSFARIVLFRFLEDESEFIGLEEELQVIAMDMIAGVFDALKERQLIRPVDSRAFVMHMISAFPMWFVLNQVRPRWFGTPSFTSVGGRKRSEEFFTDVFLRILIP